MSVALTIDDLRQTGIDAGLAAVGVTSADPMLRARQMLHERARAGLADTMAFTYKNPDRSTDPRRTISWARSLVVAACAYSAADREAEHERPAGRIARYAQADSYAPLRSGLAAMQAQLKARGFRAAVFADDNSVVDREAAWLAGIGWFGKNANLLLPGRGSWFVLGSVMTDWETETRAEPVPDGCGTCRRCFDGCPTDAIVAPGVIDARRCLAWVAQKPGPIPIEMRRPLGTRIYGCDDCQEVCPPNQRAARIEATGVSAVTGSGTTQVSATVDLLWLLGAGDEQILERHGRWYIHDRDPRWLRRNALVALGNAGHRDDDVLAVLHQFAIGDDPVLAEHAQWALDRLAAAAGPSASETAR